MDVFLLSVISAFLLFVVILPLFGVALGLFCYYVMPYVFGGLVSLGLFLVAGIELLFVCGFGLSPCCGHPLFSLSK